MLYLSEAAAESLTPEAKELLESPGFRAQVVSKIARGDEVLVLDFTPRFLSFGGWVGRLDYQVRDNPQVLTSILEGTGKSLETVQHIRNMAQLKKPKDPVYRQGRSMLQIELEGPGWERIA